MPDRMQYFSSLIRRLREHSSWTQERLAREVGVSFATVNGWENGRHCPSPLASKSLLDLARKAGLDLEKLDYREES